MIKAVLLDVDNTLLDFDACARSSIAQAAQELALSLPAETFPVFRRINDRLWGQIEQGALSRAELLDIRWNLIFQELGVTADGPAFERFFVRYLASSAELVPGAVQLLEYLRGKYIIGIASNAPYGQQVRRLKLAGLYPFVQHLFISEQIGHSKPKAEFFRACCQALEPIQPYQIMMIGDSLQADIAGAAAYGLKTCWFRHDHGANAENVQADYTVDALESIKAFL